MKKLNNEGQTLVLFILLIPILLTFAAIIIKLGLNSIEKRQTDKTVKYVVEYGVKNRESEDIESKLTKLLNSNLDNITDLEISVSDEVIVKVKIKFNNIFDNMFKNNISNYEVKYSGYMENEKIKIVRG